MSRIKNRRPFPGTSWEASKTTEKRKEAINILKSFLSKVVFIERARNYDERAYTNEFQLFLVKKWRYPFFVEAENSYLELEDAERNCDFSCTWDEDNENNKENEDVVEFSIADLASVKKTTLNTTVVYTRQLVVR